MCLGKGRGGGLGRRRDWISTLGRRLCLSPRFWAKAGFLPASRLKCCGRYVDKHMGWTAFRKV